MSLDHDTVQEPAADPFAVGAKVHRPLSEEEREVRAREAGDRRQDAEWQERERDEEAEQALYADHAAEREAEDDAVRATSEILEGARKAGHARDDQTYDIIQKALPAATERYQAEFSEFQRNVVLLETLRGNPSAYQAARQALEAEAQRLGSFAAQLHRGHMANAQAALLQARPALRDPATREALIKWAARKYAVTEEQVRAIQDPTLIARGFDAWQEETGAARAKEEAGAKTAATREAERKRKAKMSPEALVNETKGHVDPGIALYGTAEERKAHQRALRKAWREPEEE
jgi:hypothetical protein